MSGPWDGLPAALRALVPELDTLPWRAEPRADCARCPMTDGRFGPWSFTEDTRCCTAQPPLPNFLAGRALRRGGQSREVVLARIAARDGVSAWGIDPADAELARHETEGAERFGRDPTLRCPYWVGGAESCGIWHDRTSTCRTWFCKHEEGLAGAVAWSRVHQVVGNVESHLAIWAIERGDPPGDGAEVAAWAAWFERAAALVDAARPADLAPLATPGLRRYRAELGGFVAARRLRRLPLPDVLVPSVTETARVGDDVLVTGYSSFDAVRAPASVFALLAALDGTRRWRDVLAELADPRLDAALVRELHRVMALRDPSGADDLPYDVEMADRDRWSRAAR